MPLVPLDVRPVVAEANVNATGGIVYRALSGEPVPGQRVVRLSTGRVVLFRPDTDPVPEPVLGISSEGVLNAGDMVPVVRAGLVGGFVGLEVGKPYFCGLDGVPTLTPPLTGWFLKIGVAESPTQLFVTFNTAIKRGGVQ